MTQEICEYKDPVLEDCNAMVADRINFLRNSEGVKVSEGSLKVFTGILDRKGMVPPTSIGLNDNGLICASWQNPHASQEHHGSTYPGVVSVIFPEPDGYFQLTAMFGDVESEKPWIQVVGDMEEQDAMVFLDHIISSFCKQP